MNDQPGGGFQIPNPGEITASMAVIGEKSRKLVSEFLTRQAEEGFVPIGDPTRLGRAFFEMTTKMMNDPVKVAEAQMSLWRDYMNLWQNTADRMLGQPCEDMIAPERGDKRFRDHAWEENEVFNFIKQSYLLTARWMQGVVNDVDGLDEKTTRKIDFYTRQFVDALSPSNFVMTNPEVLRETMESGGENLVNGLENLLEDLERGKGQLRIRMTDLDAFKVGDNIAKTPGKVVYRNTLMELIQYEPTTRNVSKIPVLIVPPWINKYYILDLREKNSFIKWTVDQGHTVFVVSWVNPDEKLASKTFEDYMLEGLIDAIDRTLEQTGESRVNAVGYCIGGTLLSCALAHMTARKTDKKVAGATYFTTMIDFEDAGELAVFIDEEQLVALEAKMNERGYLEGSEMAATFNMMRDNDLIWSFVVNNYLLGKDPFPFDLLYWNQDNTRMPAAMHGFYLRNMYLENRLRDPGGVVLAGTPIDLTKITVPSYLVSTREDHIAPWRSTYAAMNLYSGPVRFVLAASGHIAGIINPPSADKYCHWINNRKAATPDAWLKGASRKDGSWWPDWHKWIKSLTGNKTMVPARDPSKGPLRVLGPAPGKYVVEK